MKNIKILYYRLITDSVRLYKFKQFIKDYRLPVLATLAFVIIVCSLLWIRSSERSRLADMLPSKSGASQDYANLLSGDTTEGLSKNDTTEASPALTPNQATTSTNIPLTIANTSSSQPAPTAAGSTPVSDGGAVVATPPPTSVPPPTTPTLPPTLPFRSSIASLNYSISNIPCTTVIIPNRFICSKQYTYSAVVDTYNGPGSVSYEWQSSITSENQAGSFIVGSGNGSTNLRKTITLSCDLNMKFTLDLHVSSPTPESSEEIDIRHSC